MIMKYGLLLMTLLTLLCELRPFDRDLADMQYEFAATQLDRYFIFREKLPRDLYGFSSPEALYESVDEPYTEYLNRERAEVLFNHLTTRTGGIGIWFDSVSNGFLIKQVFTGSPGEEAGLRAKDTIVQVGERRVGGMPLDSFYMMLQGDIGTDVVLRIKRGGDLQNITVTRGEFTSPSVLVDSVDTSTAMIILGGFYYETILPGGSAQEFEEALQKTEWADNTILDLRGNGGGYLDQCFLIVGQMVEDSTPIIDFRQRFYDEEADESVESRDTVFALGGGAAADRPFYILVDRNTASASEILVACLMERDGVTVVGDSTFGKGRGQILLEGPDKVVAKITFQTYTPIGENAVAYDTIGIAPDTLLAGESEEDAFELALDLIYEDVPAKLRPVLAGRKPGRADVSVHCTVPNVFVRAGYHDD
jgi:carboxyl-terminal processing protease